MSLIVNTNNPSGFNNEGNVTRKVFDVFWSFSVLEGYINNTIATYYASTNNHEFLDDILRTDIISFRSKVMLLKTIARHLNMHLDDKDLHACRSIRNKFAHGYYSDPDETDIFTGEALPPSILSNGTYYATDDAYADFSKHYSPAFDEVQKLFLTIVNYKQEN